MKRIVNRLSNIDTVVPGILGGKLPPRDAGTGTYRITLLVEKRNLTQISWKTARITVRIMIFLLNKEDENTLSIILKATSTLNNGPQKWSEIQLRCGGHGAPL